MNKVNVGGFSVKIRRCPGQGVEPIFVGETTRNSRPGHNAERCDWDAKRPTNNADLLWNTEILKFGVSVYKLLILLI